MTAPAFSITESGFAASPSPDAILEQVGFSYVGGIEVPSLVAAPRTLFALAWHHAEWPGLAVTYIPSNADDQPCNAWTLTHRKSGRKVGLGWHQSDQYATGLPVPFAEWLNGHARLLAHMTDWRKTARALRFVPGLQERVRVQVCAWNLRLADATYYHDSTYYQAAGASE